MKLLELNLINFKGIRNFTFSPDGQDANIYGANRTGKTTLKDAFLWLFFGKDSQNKAEFDIKTLDEDKKPIPAIDHEVSARLELDPAKKPVELRRVYYEKWTKKRKAEIKQLTGHSTNYYIDDVPFTETEYKKFISEIFDEETFRLLIDTYYFAETLQWQKRRSLLFKICRDANNIKDEEIINSNPDLSELTALLNGRTIESHKKFIKGRQNKINEELDIIPARIDENKRAISNGNGDQADESEISRQIESLKSDIGKKRQERIDLQQGGGIAEKRKELAEAENQLTRYQFDYEAQLNNSLAVLKKELRDIENKMEEIDRKCASKQRIYDENDEEIEKIESELPKLREQWHKTDDEKLTYKSPDTCPTCGQSLPEDQIQAANEKALADFNKAKAEELEKIQEKGQAMREKSEKLQAENKSISEEIDNLKAELQKLDAQATGYDGKIEALRITRENYTKDKEYIALTEKKDNLSGELVKLVDGQNRDAIQKIDEEIESIEKILAETEGTLAQIKQAKAIKSRIEDLDNQQKFLGKEFERLNKEMSLIERFTTIKAEMVEENVNQRFALAHFKLFKPHINGGLEDCCEVTDAKGVSYSSGLSNSECINIGLDIINTLSRHYGFAPPIFVDNAESNTDIIKTKGQQIRLYVQAGQEELKILTA